MTKIESVKKDHMDMRKKYSPTKTRIIKKELSSDNSRFGIKGLNVKFRTIIISNSDT